MAAITICSDFGAPKLKSDSFNCFPIYLPWSDGMGCHDLRFLNVELWGNFVTLLFHFHQEVLQFFYTFCHNGGVISISSVQFSNSVMSDSATPWIAARQASLSITSSQSSLKLMSFESVVPSIHLILGCPLLLLPLIPPSIRDFSSESTLHMRWPKYWSFSFSIIPSK